MSGETAGEAGRASPDDLFARLERLGIATRTVRHEAVFTVAESQALRGRIPGLHSKNLFLRDKKDRMWLVTAREDTRVDLKWLNERLGAARLSFGSAERLLAHLGVEPGSVTPFALVNDTAHRVSFVLDAALAEGDVLNFHPLTNTMTTSIARADFLRFLEDVGHEPMVVGFGD